MSRMMRLVEYPYVVVRVTCRYCDRKGSYRLARLAERFGADHLLRLVLVKLAEDCPHIADPGVRSIRGCGVQALDVPPDPPPDLPPTTPYPLRVIDGGLAEPEPPRRRKREKSPTRREASRAQVKGGNARPAQGSAGGQARPAKGLPPKD